MPQRPITDLEGNIIGYAPSYQAPAIQSNDDKKILESLRNVYGKNSEGNIGF